MPTALNQPYDAPPTLTRTQRALRALRSLRGLNAAMASMHALLFVVTCAVADFGLHVDVYTVKLHGGNVSELETMSPSKLEAVVNGEPFYLKPSLTTRDDLALPISFLTASFFAITAIFHAGNAFFWNSAYRRCIERCTCPYRWLEYSITAPLMLLIIAYAAGVVIDAELTLLVALTVLTMCLGHVTEQAARPAESRDAWASPASARFAPHLMGFFAQFVVWVVVICRFAQNADDAPDFVSVIVASQVALFVSFGFVQSATLSRPPSRYIQGEVAYVLLSFVSKATLGLILIANVAHFANWECAMPEVRRLLPEGSC